MRSMIILILVIVGIFFFLGCSRSNNKVAGLKMSMQDAKAKMETMEAKDYLIVDVRQKNEYEDGHLPGALLIPNETISGEVKKLPDKDKTIFVYCRSGNRSGQAAKKLTDAGYTNIIDIGGIGGWPGELEK